MTANSGWHSSSATSGSSPVEGVVQQHSQRRKKLQHRSFQQQQYPRQQLYRQPHHYSVHYRQHYGQQQSFGQQLHASQQQQEEFFCGLSADIASAGEDKAAAAASYYYNNYAAPQTGGRGACSSTAAALGIGKVSGFFLCLFLTAVAAAIAFVTAGPTAYEYYVSCHGSKNKFSHHFYTLILALQLFCIVLHWPLPSTAASEQQQRSSRVLLPTTTSSSGLPLTVGTFRNSNNVFSQQFSAAAAVAGQSSKTALSLHNYTSSSSRNGFKTTADSASVAATTGSHSFLPKMLCSTAPHAGSGAGEYLHACSSISVELLSQEQQQLHQHQSLEIAGEGSAIAARNHAAATRSKMLRPNSSLEEEEDLVSSSVDGLSEGEKVISNCSSSSRVGVCTARTLLGGVIIGSNSSRSRRGYTPANAAVDDTSSEHEENDPERVSRSSGLPMEEEPQTVSSVRLFLNSAQTRTAHSHPVQHQQRQQQQSHQSIPKGRRNSRRTAFDAADTVVDGLDGRDEKVLLSKRSENPATALPATATAAISLATENDSYAEESASTVCGWKSRGVDWNSLWMLLEFVIYGLGFYGAVLGWRVYGGGATTANYITWSTCSHLNEPSFAADLPVLHNVVSDFVFLEGFAAFASLLLLVRKLADPYKLSSYGRLFSLILRARSRLLRTFFFLQLFLQVALFSTAITNAILCWTTGYGTPMQIISAGILVSATLWVAVVLSHVLQVDRLFPPVTPTLEYHWLWSMICLAIIWLCGFLFYLSVYGTYSVVFLSLHAAAWLLFLFITFIKFSAIFPQWISGTEEEEEQKQVAASSHYAVPHSAVAALVQAGGDG